MPCNDFELSARSEAMNTSDKEAVKKANQKERAELHKQCGDIKNEKKQIKYRKQN